MEGAGTVPVCTQLFRSRSRRVRNDSLMSDLPVSLRRDVTATVHGDSRHAAD
jgi:hypothetical protein